MKFYRVKYRIDAGCSAGCSWHPSRADADAAAKKAMKNDPEEYQNEPPEVEEIHIMTTKVGILGALTMYASHPDNG